MMCVCHALLEPSLAFPVLYISRVYSLHTEEKSSLVVPHKILQYVRPALWSFGVASVYFSVGRPVVDIITFAQE